MVKCKQLSLFSSVQVVSTNGALKERKKERKKEGKKVVFKNVGGIETWAERVR